MAAIFVGVGAFFGGCLRSLLATVLNSDNHRLPWGTIMANIIGCCFLGGIVQAIHDQDLTNSMQLILAIGFSGGLTTFSTFTKEVWGMIKQHQIKLAMGYWIVCVGVCMFLFLIGMKLKTLV
ncbi:fluoride efflux transporter FluC [Limosilactobacillus equigenerosi]|uniref:Fluoride-specific ion channel FluC n=1 Tax=Limosilactobacillus equigenerosi DSM 18793 = JCM 14505 TaxID=1423742 RepID=A0A0R1UI09_9LACO|nr:CrcB family protein [Limosilactobacillus equigenerosi]KRL93023.1 hypothetical protein FC21_GL000124 [Limosilactobacillus equigenerosi DSM 18793 = JCM 14505]